MKKSMYIIGSLEAVLGALVLWATKLISGIIPLLGRIAFQAASAGSYSPGDYAVESPFLSLVGWVLVLAGIVQILLSFLGGKKC